MESYNIPISNGLYYKSIYFGDQILTLQSNLKWPEKYHNG